MTDAHHLERKVSCNHLGCRMLPEGLAGQIASAGADIEQKCVWAQSRLMDDLFSPSCILSRGHQAIHDFVAVGYTRKHSLDVFPSFLTR